MLLFSYSLDTPSLLSGRPPNSLFRYFEFFGVSGSVEPFAPHNKRHINTNKFAGLSWDWVHGLLQGAAQRECNFTLFCGSPEVAFFHAPKSAFSTLKLAHPREGNPLKHRLMGGCQRFVYVPVSGSFLMGLETSTLTKSPPKSQHNPVK